MRGRPTPETKAWTLSALRVPGPRPGGGLFMWVGSFRYSTAPGPSLASNPRGMAVSLTELKLPTVLGQSLQIMAQAVTVHGQEETGQGNRLRTESSTENALDRVSAAAGTASTG